MPLFRLYSPTSVQGAPIKVSQAKGNRPRTIFITVFVVSAADHSAFVSHSRQDVTDTTPGGSGASLGTVQGGLALPVKIGGAAPDPVVNQAGVHTYVLQGWVGDMWAAADVDGAVTISVEEDQT